MDYQSLIMRFRSGQRWVLALLVFAPIAGWTQTVALPHTFENNTTASATEINANFEALVNAINETQTAVGLQAESGEFVIDFRNYELNLSVTS